MCRKLICAKLLLRTRLRPDGQNRHVAAVRGNADTNISTTVIIFVAIVQFMTFCEKVFII